MPSAKKSGMENVSNANQDIKRSMEDVLEEILSVLNTTKKESVSSALMTLLFSKELVSKKTNNVSATVRMVDAINARITIL